MLLLLLLLRLGLGGAELLEKVSDGAHLAAALHGLAEGVHDVGEVGPDGEAVDEALAHELHGELDPRGGPALVHLVGDARVNVLGLDQLCADEEDDGDDVELAVLLLVHGQQGHPVDHVPGQLLALVPERAEEGDEDLEPEEVVALGHLLKEDGLGELERRRLLLARIDLLGDLGDLADQGRDLVVRAEDSHGHLAPGTSLLGHVRDRRLNRRDQPSVHCDCLARVQDHRRLAAGRELPWGALERLVHQELLGAEPLAAWAQDLWQGARVAAAGVHRVHEGLALLLGLAPRSEVWAQRLLDVPDGGLGSSLLDEHAPELQVVCGTGLHRLLHQGHLGIGLLEQRVEVVRDGQAQGLLARDHGQGAGQVRHHELGCLAHLRVAGLHGEVLHDELLGADACDGHGPLHHRLDDLPDRPVHGHGHDGLELRALHEERQLRVRRHIRRQVRDQRGLVRRSRGPRRGASLGALLRPSGSGCRPFTPRSRCGPGACRRQRRRRPA
mmetsp:Transcript_19868/g.58024  ORF Transcript_19868/g.58024 Transcript_19868/m.58024 type:complete len:499 (-) Transcript_19868:77-1573(-)